VSRFFLRALALPLARSHRRQQRNNKNPSFLPSFLPTLLFRAICSLRTVSTFIYDKNIRIRVHEFEKIRISTYSFLSFPKTLPFFCG
jgi:hypothetical protein